VYGLKEAFMVAEAAVKMPTEVSARLSNASILKALSPPSAKINSAALNTLVFKKMTLGRWLSDQLESKRQTS